MHKQPDEVLQQHGQKHDHELKASVSSTPRRRPSRPSSSRSCEATDTLGSEAPPTPPGRRRRRLRGEHDLLAADGFDAANANRDCASCSRHGVDLEVWGLRPSARDYLGFLRDRRRPVRMLRARSVAAGLSARRAQARQVRGDHAFWATPALRGRAVRSDTRGTRLSAGERRRGRWPRSRSHTPGRGGARGP